MTEPSTDVVIREPSRSTLSEKLIYAKQLAESGLLPKAFRGQPANVLYAVEYGDMLGLSPMAAITGIHVIEGKPSASAALMSALVRRAGHRLRITGNDEKSIVEIVRSDDPDFVFRSEWTMLRAKQAGLAGKQVWKNYPAAMLKARAVSECARDACEEVLCGLHYTPEELGVDVDEEGQPIQATATRVSAPVVSGRDWKVEIDKCKTDGDLAGLERLWNQARRDIPADKEIPGLIRAAVAAIKDRANPVEFNTNGVVSAEIVDEPEPPARTSEPPVVTSPEQAAPSESAPTSGLTDADWDAAIAESVEAGDLEGLYDTYYSALAAEPENTELHERIKAVKPQLIAVIDARSGEQHLDAVSPDGLGAEHLTASKTRDELRKHLFALLGEGGVSDTKTGRETRLRILSRLLKRVPVIESSDELTDTEIAGVITTLTRYRNEGRLNDELNAIGGDGGP